MHVVLVGADFEENLGLGLLAAVARQRGHEVRVEPFNARGLAPKVARSLAALAPDVIGLGIQFQHRAHEFLSLARMLREAGFRGHLTCGGQFPSLAFAEVLGEGQLDSVVFYDGESTFGALLDALEAKTPLASVAGLALRDARGVVFRTADRPLPADLDDLPFPVRYRPHATHCGVPFVPIMGSRGCWGRCAYCSITSHYRDARAHGGGKTLRLRSPENVADEMAQLTEKAGRPCIFCFHDDNLLLPRPEDTLERLRAVRGGLDARGVGKVGIIGKCRPETLTPELAVQLRGLGVIRLYVGVENASERGAAHLGRGKQHLAIDAALRACEKAGIFTCYNLLLFEPEATLDDVEENVDFIRRHASHPVNFCRAEPYHGTPLQAELLARDALGGSYLGYDYRIGDDRAELLFRICAAAFRERNFQPDGVANRYMGLGYNMKVLEQFYPDVDGERARLARQVAALTRQITLDTAAYLARAVDLARDADLSDHDVIERRAARLGLEISASDAIWHRELDAAYASFEAYSQRVVHWKVPPAIRRVARGVAVGTALAVGALGTACGGKTNDPTPDGSVVSDPVPEDAGMDVRDASVDVEPDVMVADPPPPDAGFDARLDVRRLRLIDQWRDTSPRRSIRSDDLPLFAPPDVQLAGRREGDVIVARLEGGPEAVSTRWEGDGTVDGDGREVRWSPEDDGVLRVAVRSHGGLAIVSLRARAVTG